MHRYLTESSYSPAPSLPAQALIPRGEDPSAATPPSLSGEVNRLGAVGTMAALGLVAVGTGARRDKSR